LYCSCTENEQYSVCLYHVEVTACTSPELDEYRIYAELPVLVKQKFASENGCRAIFKKGILYFVTQLHVKCHLQCSASSINKSNIAFIFMAVSCDFTLKE
jgi:hypothetical protein